MSGDLSDTRDSIGMAELQSATAGRPGRGKSSSDGVGGCQVRAAEPENESSVEVGQREFRALVKDSSIPR